MRKHTKEGLAALCLMANGFKADSFARERLKDGRITHIVHTFEDGKDVVRVLSGIVPGHYTTGRSAIEESDARAQALMAFAGHEMEEQAKRPSDLVALDAPLPGEVSPCS